MQINATEGQSESTMCESPPMRLHAVSNGGLWVFRCNNSRKPLSKR